MDVRLNCNLVALLLLISVLPSFGATYYVRTDGNDSNTGTANTSGGAWLTQQKAWNTATNGDVIKVEPGVYSRTGFDTTANDGVTLVADQGQFTVTNTYGLSIRNSWITNRGVIYPGPFVTSPSFNFDTGGDISGGSAIFVRGQGGNGNNPTNVTIDSCWTINFSNDMRGIAFMGHSAIVPGDHTHTNGPQSCLVTNCLMANYDSSDVGPIEWNGYGNLMVNTVITNGKANWGLLLKGMSNTIRSCTITYVGGLIHPDIFQSFMTGGATDVGSGQWPQEAYGWILEDCVMGGCPSLMQMETYTNPTNSVVPFGSHTIRNCVIMNVGAANSEVRNLAFLNDIFINVQGMAFQFYTSNCWSRLDQWEWPGDSFGLTINNCAYINSPFPSFQIDTNYAGSYGMNLTSNYFANWNGSAWSAGASSLITNNNTITFGANVYNCYPGVVGGASTVTLISGLWPGNINTGLDPKLAGGTSWSLWTNFYTSLRPMLGSPLIDAGTNDVVSSDFENTVRPKGVGYDIGPFEFDTNLLVHFDFDDPSFTNQTRNYVLDVTGYGHNAVFFDGTNLPAVGLGTVGDAWRGYTNGLVYADIHYTKAQYAGITNIDNAIGFITNGTIAFWAKIGAQSERYDAILDSTFSTPFSTGNSTNSWGFIFGNENQGLNGGTPQLMFILSSLNDPTTDTTNILITFPVGVRDGVWHHYAVVFSCTNNNIVGYQDGSPNKTNTVNGAASLNIYGHTPKWLCFGARPHDGTPSWTDNEATGPNGPYTYPDYGFWKTNMDEVRIYNRALSATEVQNLALVGPSQQSGGGGGASATATINLNNATFQLNNATLQMQ